ncbi:ribosome small subunit-dependent GTPase A [Actinocorallia populi]|uniref:ribosome small subunit-dependent GTPase A n=1 Tax=Actinocorallia populi TaxID=2079200 RepID=UPI000D08DC7C|nr:ribosome small subunit-dependent GTPase A [Actinocorallia populi]
MAFSLFSLGFDASFSAALEPGYTAGRVSRVDRGSCDVLCEHGERRVPWSGTLTRAASHDPVALPCVGDWVAFDTAIRGVLPRRTSIVRAGVRPGDSHGQVLAANVDVVHVVEPALPEPDLGRIERLLTLAWESGARPVVVVTKADLADPDGLLDGIAAAAPGAEVRLVSARTGEGLDALRPAPGETAVLLGRSGAGKSTLVNALAGAELMQTGAIREADGRGRHTTVHRELLILPGGGMIIDTPGLRGIGLHDAGDGLALAFSDVEELAGECRFADCAHEGEPGCAVLAAVESGDLPERRLASWRKLRREAEWAASRTDARLRAERTRQWKVIHKSMRGRNRP